MLLQIQAFVPGSSANQALERRGRPQPLAIQRGRSPVVDLFSMDCEPIQVSACRYLNNMFSSHGLSRGVAASW
jgi:hypothetical protein